MHKNHTLETFVAFGQSRLSCASLRLHQDLHAHLLGEVSRRASAGPPHPSSGGRRPQWSWRMWTKLCEDVYRIQVLCLSETMPVKGSNAKIHSFLLDTCPSCGLLAAIPIKVVYIHALLPLKQPLMTPPTFCGRRRAFVQETKLLLGQDNVAHLKHAISILP